jgi:hypothetical protein
MCHVSARPPRLDYVNRALCGWKKWEYRIIVLVGSTWRREQNPVLQMCFLNKNRMMDNVQKHDICINVPLPQTFRF